MKSIYNYQSILPEGVIHAKGMPEGWVTEREGEFIVTWCPLKFEAENGTITAKIQLMDFGNGK